eukprot:scaffold23144_cov39-Tisochrysis_lutea.AAC.5
MIDRRNLDTGSGKAAHIMSYNYPGDVSDDINALNRLMDIGSCRVKRNILFEADLGRWRGGGRDATYGRTPDVGSNASLLRMPLEVLPRLIGCTLLSS